ncbi:hypothetical protein Nepgr_002519 [Nepenthes gracilis]|uniref:NPH3 domain-containing protein n=1 Tax=Nepenthes gracilis TaxID=150966 RepID=A0AAD3RYH0_NEPGR|nr:hypothetical protein Nepgr_002519 [Nepenthes gracilis]
MALSRSVEPFSWQIKPESTSHIRIGIGGVPFTLDKRLLAKRSARLATLLDDTPHEDLGRLLHNIPADLETLELIARFCHGFDINMSSENIIPLICLADYLKMTENHSANNLLKAAHVFFEQKILPSWNESIKSLHSAGHTFQQAMQLCLVDACSESLTAKALANPGLLGDPATDLKLDGEDKEDHHRYGKYIQFICNARQRLFVCGRKSEELTSLPLHLYKHIIERMIHGGVPQKNIARSLCLYVKRWICSFRMQRDSQREVIEVVERLLPCKKDLLPCSLLFEMLRISIALEASFVCRNGLEIRIGKQLGQAMVKDLFIPSVCYSNQVECDVETVRRIMQSYFENFESSDASGLVKVAKLMEDFLAETARDGGLKVSAFVSLAEMASSASVGTDRCCDGIYGAVDIYLDKNQHLTESERVNACRVLDFHKMSPRACEHAAQNQRLPLRVTVKALFASQLQLRDAITKEAQQSDYGSGITRVGEEDEGNLGSDEEERIEIEEKMNRRLLESEERGDVEEQCCCHKQKKVSLWREMKKKFCCMSGLNDV